MRILSQDGNIDVNYDFGNLSIARGRCEDVERASIYFHSCSCANATRLAEYTSLDKARKAMEMLREQYAKLCSVSIYLHGGMELFAKSISQGEAGAFSIEYKNMNVFQFPPDDELEVQQ